MVHGCIRDVEGKRRDGRVHKDAEVVAQVCACYAERPHGGQDERGAGCEEGERGELNQGVGEERVCWLRFEGCAVAVFGLLTYGR